MAEHDDWHFLHAELPRGENSGVPCQDAIIGINQNWIRPAEFANRRGNLRDLRWCMRARIIGSWQEPANRPKLNLDVDIHVSMIIETPNDPVKSCNTGSYLLLTGD